MEGVKLANDNNKKKLETCTSAVSSFGHAYFWLEKIGKSQPVYS